MTLFLAAARGGKLVRGREALEHQRTALERNHHQVTH